MSQKTCSENKPSFPRGWGTGEDEEAGAILKVRPGLGDFFYCVDGLHVSLL